MNDHELETARLGMEALDGALADLGLPPLGENLDVHMAAPVVGDVPNAVVERPGCAPLRFVFGRELDVWVGPYSGVVSSTVLEETRDQLRELIGQVLRSEVTFRLRKKSVDLALRAPGTEPWLRLKVRGADAATTLEAHYEPLAR